MSDKQQKALESYNDALLYATECMRAVERIGGDPATVGELVAALRLIADDDYNAAHLSIAQQDALAAVLGKLPENSND